MRSRLYYIVCLFYLVYSLNAYVLPAHAFYSFGNQLIDAVEGGFQGKAQDLLISGMPIDSRGKFGVTALMRASYKGDAQMLNMLLQCGANPDLQDIGGATALHIALREGHTEIVRILLEAHANPHLKDLEGLTPMDYANNFQRNMESYLLRNAEPSEPMPEAAPKAKQNQTVDEQNLPWLPAGEEVSQDTEYVHTSNDSLIVAAPVPAQNHIKAEALPSAQRDATHGIALKEEPTKPIPSSNPKKRSAGIAVKGSAPSTPPAKEKTAHNLVVQEAVKVPDNFNPSTDTVAIAKTLTAIPVVHAELTGTTDEKAVIASIALLSQRYPDKYFNNSYGKAGISIHVTPFATPLEAETWCQNFRTIANKWQCRAEKLN